MLKAIQAIAAVVSWGVTAVAGVTIGFSYFDVYFFSESASDIVWYIGLGGFAIAFLLSYEGWGNK